jgi:hypothetical protein
MKKRTRSRELALQFLYQLDLRGDELLPEAKNFTRSEERDAETVKFALRLVEGTFEHWDELDRTIQAVAQNWNISRMAVVDRNVLRLATYEPCTAGHPAQGRDQRGDRARQALLDAELRRVHQRHPRQDHEPREVVERARRRVRLRRSQLDAPIRNRGRRDEPRRRAATDRIGARPRARSLGSGSPGRGLIAEPRDGVSMPTRNVHAARPSARRDALSTRR